MGSGAAKWRRGTAPIKNTMAAFNGLNMGLGNLSRLSRAKTRSISAENFTGEKGRAGMATEGTGAIAARELGQGWKVSPSDRKSTRLNSSHANISYAVF